MAISMSSPRSIMLHFAGSKDTRAPVFSAGVGGTSSIFNQQRGFTAPIAAPFTD